LTHRSLSGCPSATQAQGIKKPKFDDLSVSVYSKNYISGEFENFFDIFLCWFFYLLYHFQLSRTKKKEVKYVVWKCANFFVVIEVTWDRMILKFFYWEFLNLILISSFHSGRI
jgi:hypothetical protein